MDFRQSRVYWIPARKDRKDLLIFDAGFGDGNIQLYEINATIQISEIEKDLMKNYKTEELPESVRREAVSIWVESKYGFPKQYDIKR